MKRGGLPGCQAREAPGAGPRPRSAALLRASLSCIFSSGDCTAHYYFHMFLQEIIEGKYMNSPLFGMLTGYRNVCRWRTGTNGPHKKSECGIMEERGAGLHALHKDKLRCRFQSKYSRGEKTEEELPRKACSATESTGPVAPESPERRTPRLPPTNGNFTVHFGVA